MPDEQLNFDEPIVVDLTQAKDPDAGEYMLCIEVIKPFRATPSDKNPKGLVMADMQLAVVQDRDGEEYNTKIFQKFGLSGGSARQIKQLLIALELIDEDATEPEISIMEMVDSEVWAYCGMSNSKDPRYPSRFEVKSFIAE